MSQANYSLDQFGRMLEDKIRMDAYSAAIARAVQPNDAVVDLGCGPGVFALLACKAGARSVYAIDTNGVVEFGRHLAAVNGFSDRIHFLRGDSRQIHLPERVNVIVSDIRGSLPLYSHAVGTLEDARNRFLATGGRLLPTRDTLRAAVVQLSEYYHHVTSAWRDGGGQLELSSALPLVLNTTYRYQLRPEHLLSESCPWHVLDYLAGAKTTAQSCLKLPILRNAVGHGLGIWFETQLIDNIGYSSGPQSGETVYGHLFLPWLEPVALREGEICHVDLRAHLVGSDYIWQWETNLPATEGRDQMRFRQSTFYGSIFPPSLLQKRTVDFVPVLNESGQAERWILQAMDGKRPLQEIAAEAARLYPHVFRREEDAFNQAADIAEKFSR
jgi:type I protein arginine methyltransferase